MSDPIMPIRVNAVSLTLSILLGSAAAPSGHPSAQEPRGAGAMPSSARMGDGLLWTAHNLDVDAAPSYCYDDAEINCRQYGRLYTWEAAQRGCRSLGDGWRLPTNDEWRRMAQRYGGLMEDSAAGGEATYRALSSGGSAGLHALLGGSRMPDGRYDRLRAHGFYWTASESSPSTAWFYNFGLGGQSLNRHSGGDKRMAVSVRCVSG